MARRIAYTGAPVLTPQDIAIWRRNDAVLLESALLADIIIPGVVAQAEARTGAAIQEARYVEIWPASRPSGHHLDIGQAKRIDAVDVLSADGVPVPSGAVYSIRQGQHESTLHFAGSRPSGELQITYTAGADLAAYPSVRNWLLLNIGTVYAQRESLVIGASVAELPATYLDSMLSDITVPPRF